MKNEIDIKKIIKDFSFIIVIAIIACYALISVFFSTSVVDIFGFEASVIKSKSMQGTINKYDMVFVGKPTNYLAKVNDIVVFLDNSGQHKIIHRIIEVKTENNKTLVKTKGDNNPLPDNVFTDSNNLYAVYLFHIPLLGLLVTYLTSYLGISNIVVWFAVFIYIDTLWQEEKFKQDERKIITSNKIKF